MGLDQYLKVKTYFSGGWNHSTELEKKKFYSIIRACGLKEDTICKDSPGIEISYTVAYWRKANQVHQWFVDNVQDGEDNYRQHYVTREDLTNLRSLCREVLTMRDRQNANPDEALPTADDILPTQPGFFFGSEEYDEYYYEQVQYTFDRLSEILGNEKLIDFDFAYDSSW